MDAVARQLLVDAYWSRLDPSYCDGEGAESFAGLYERAESFLRAVTELSGFGVVFTHEQFIRAVFVAATYPGDEPSIKLMRQFFALRTGLPIPNAAVVRLQREGTRWWVGGIDTSHSQAAEPSGCADPMPRVG
jgi:broad specificity phosphatase PhoE